MKRIIALALAVPLLASCMFPQGWHWPRATGNETVVYWQNDTVAAPVGWAAGYYNAHPELKIVMVDTCPVGRNCVVWRTGNNGGGVTSITVGSNKHLVAATVTLDDQVVNNYQGRLIVFHEACHSFGGGFGEDVHSFCNWGWRTLIFREISKVYHWG